MTCRTCNDVAGVSGFVRHAYNQPFPRDLLAVAAALVLVLVLVRIGGGPNPAVAEPTSFYCFGEPRRSPGVMVVHAGRTTMTGSAIPASKRIVTAGLCRRAVGPLAALYLSRTSGAPLSPVRAPRRLRCECSRGEGGGT